jgi:hypothetical protein
MPGDLTLQDPTGLWATLRHLQPDEAERTLGVMMAPLETGAAQHLALREKAKDWAAKFSPHKIQKSKTKNVQVIFHKQHQKLYQSYA